MPKGIPKNGINKGWFKTGTPAITKGIRKYRVICPTCKMNVLTSNKRTKYCGHFCAAKDRWKNSSYKSKGWISGSGHRQFMEGRNARLVWKRKQGLIPGGYIVHHINGMKLDDRIENLACIPNPFHTKLHHILRQIKGA